MSRLRRCYAIVHVIVLICWLFFVLESVVVFDGFYCSASSDVSDSLVSQAAPAGARVTSPPLDEQGGWFVLNSSLPHGGILSNSQHNVLLLSSSSHFPLNVALSTVETEGRSALPLILPDAAAALSTANTPRARHVGLFLANPQNASATAPLPSFSLGSSTVAPVLSRPSVSVSGGRTGRSESRTPSTLGNQFVVPSNNGTTAFAAPVTLTALSESKSTPFSHFWTGLVSSFTLTLFTEFGDRTFFVAAILCLRFPRYIVFWGSWLALVLQTIFSTILGQLFHMLPSNLTQTYVLSLPLDDYAAAILLFVFGISHLRAAYQLDSSESTVRREQQGGPAAPLLDSQDIHKQTAPSAVPPAMNCIGDCSDKYYILQNSPGKGHGNVTPDHYPPRGLSSPAANFTGPNILPRENGPAVGSPSDMPNASTSTALLSGRLSDGHSGTGQSQLVKPLISAASSELYLADTLSYRPHLREPPPGDSSSVRRQSDVPLSIYPQRDLKGPVALSPRKLLPPKGSSCPVYYAASKADRGQPLRVNDEYAEAQQAVATIEDRHVQLDNFTVFVETFWVVLVAELADKSMFSTIALATAQNPYGVFIGSSCAHFCVTLVAVAAGSFLEGYISERVANIIGAVLFLTFSVLTTLEGMARQGIPLWFFLCEKVSAFCIAYWMTIGTAAMGQWTGNVTSAALPDHTDQLTSFLRFFSAR